MTVAAAGVHRLADDEFDALAAGGGGAAVVESLVAAQLSKVRLRLFLVREAVSGLPPSTHRDRFERSFQALAELEDTHPGVLDQPGGLLRHPYLEAWTARCLRLLLQSEPSGGRRPSESDVELAAALDHFAAVAIAAAARVGASARLECVVRRETLTLPTFGQAVLAAAPGSVVSVATDDGRVSVSAHGRSVLEHWYPARRLGPSSVLLDDIDPCRDVVEYRLANRTVTGRLDDAQADRWTRAFDAAWRIIEDEYSDYLPGLRVGLAAVTPLNPPESGEASATSDDAFGAIGMTLPGDPAAVALLLLHEFQHNKLNILMYLSGDEPLYDGSDRNLYFAPWRPDPRPLPALLHGTYAHIAVTDFWRRRRHLPALGAAPAEQFARWRGYTAEAADTLLASPALSARGRRFVEAMATTLASW